VWALVLVYPAIDLPNTIDPDGKGWYFDPFSWQFLFALGMALALVLRRQGGMLRRHWALSLLATLYLVAALFQSGDWKDWGLPDLRLLDWPPPDKSHLSPVRIVDILALSYLVLSSPVLLRWSRSRWLRPLEACGKHSLEIFALCTIFAMFGRLSFRTFGAAWPMQLAVNGAAIGLMIGAAFWMERRRATARAGVPSPVSAVSP
jgi:hypothetical protein